MARYLRTDGVLRLPDGRTVRREQIDRNPALLAALAGKRLRCCCTPTGVEMLVRHRQGRHFLANLPGRTHHHAAACPSFAPDPLIDPRRHYSAVALARSGDSLHLVVSPEPLGQPPFAHLSPHAALELLWDAANLTLWSPRMRGKRSYFTVRTALLRAAERLMIHRAPLAGALFFPDPAQGVPTLAQHFIAGRVIGVYPSAHGAGFALAHSQPGHLYWLAARQWTAAIAVVFGPLAAPMLPPDLEVWMLGRFALSGAGHATLQYPGFITVTPEHRLPADDPAQAAVLRGLVEQDRRFRRCALLDARADPAIPFVVLLDTGVPCYVFTPDSTRVPPPAPRPDPSPHFMASEFAPSPSSARSAPR